MLKRRPQKLANLLRRLARVGAWREIKLKMHAIRYVPTSSASNGRWECLGRPSVEDSIEHTLEEVLHRIEPNV